MPSTLLTETTLEVAESIRRTLSRHPAAEVSARELEPLADVCRALSAALAQSWELLQEVLREHGLEGRTTATLAGSLVQAAEAVRCVIDLVAEGTRASGPTGLDEARIEVERLRDQVTELHDLAAQPFPPLDWRRLQEETAREGETRDVEEIVARLKAGEDV